MKQPDKIFKCGDCGYQSNKWFGLCPKCQSTNVNEESNVITSSTSTSKVNSKATFDKLNIKPLLRVSETIDDNINPEVIKVTQFKELNSIFSTDKGIVEGQIILLGASPGVGKSTLCCQISDEKTLYISTEETRKQVINRIKRVCNDNDPYVLTTVEEEEIYAAIGTTDANFIILDSLNSIANGTLSYVKYSQIAQKIVNLVKELGKSIIIISQVTKNDNIIGMESLVHCVDTVIHMERSAISENIILSSSKNRFSEAGRITLFRHRENGLEEVEPQVTDSNSLIGTTQFFMVSGGKKMPMEVQCLIIETEDQKTFKRSVGIDYNKVYIIDAILRHSDIGFKTFGKDVFLSTSNGLTLPEGNDLAIANSMLSAYYEKVIPELANYGELNGMLNLNGTISGNKKYKHIVDIIKLYKKKGK